MIQKGRDSKTDSRIRAKKVSSFCATIPESAGKAVRYALSRDKQMDQITFYEAEYNHKKRKLFPTDDSAKKVIYLAIQDASKRWTMPIRNWKLGLIRFMIEFEDQLVDYV